MDERVHSLITPCVRALAVLSVPCGESWELPQGCAPAGELQGCTAAGEPQGCTPAGEPQGCTAAGEPQGCTAAGEVGCECARVPKLLTCSLGCVLQDHAPNAPDGGWGGKNI